MFDAIGEVVLPRRVVPQPTPELVPGGDCGACVLAGALAIPIERVYDELMRERKAIHPGEMSRICRAVTGEPYDLADRHIDEPASWPSKPLSCSAFGRPSHLEYLPWFNYVRMAIDAGYYGIAMVDSNNAGGVDGGTNHWVLICGARNRGPAAYDNTITGEVLVSCSRRSTGGVDEWVEAFEFLKSRGGYNLLFIRPTRTP